MKKTHLKGILLISLILISTTLVNAQGIYLENHYTQLINFSEKYIPEEFQNEFINEEIPYPFSDKRKAETAPPNPEPIMIYS